MSEQLGGHYVTLLRKTEIYLEVALEVIDAHGLMDEYESLRDHADEAMHEDRMQALEP